MLLLLVGVREALRASAGFLQAKVTQKLSFSTPRESLCHHSPGFVLTATNSGICMHVARVAVHELLFQIHFWEMRP